MAKGAAEVGSTANRYQILAKLAVGGMAEIFLARGAGVGGVERYCVLKRVLRERASDAELVRMFLDEARLAAQLQHPNIAQVFDVGMLGESYFFTMEYVHGETVRSLLQRGHELSKKVPLPCALTIVAGAAAGLHHAHERNAADGRPLGIVHRDVSPSNLMVSYEGNVKLVDFGVAKAADRAYETMSGTVKGKISYLSPEQCRAERVDRRSDLFSLGIVMWELLTGTRLYRRGTDFENMTAIVTEEPPPPSSRRPELPLEVDEIVLRLLAKSPARRFQTAAAVVEAIENAAMRAGTILSAQAVARLVREMFGERPEPWLALAVQSRIYDSLTLQSRPVPPSPESPESLELSAEPLESVEIELAAVPELAPPTSLGLPRPRERRERRASGQPGMPGASFVLEGQSSWPQPSDTDQDGPRAAASSVSTLRDSDDANGLPNAPADDLRPRPAMPFSTFPSASPPAPAPPPSSHRPIALSPPSPLPVRPATQQPIALPARTPYAGPNSPTTVDPHAPMPYGAAPNAITLLAPGAPPPSDSPVDLLQTIRYTPGERVDATGTPLMPGPHRAIGLRPNKRPRSHKRTRLVLPILAVLAATALGMIGARLALRSSDDSGSAAAPAPTGSADSPH